MTAAARPLLCVLVDAVRHDYVDPARMPYLAARAEELGVARIRPILGYSDSIRATIFTGAYPDEHGYWMEYRYRPGSSAFGPLGRLAPLDSLPSDFVRRGTKFVLSQTAGRVLARRGGYRTLPLRNLPFRALGSFDWTLKAGMLEGALGRPTLFERLNEAGVGWAYLDSSELGRGLPAALDRLDPDTRLVFVYLHHVDMASHVVGIEGRLFERALARTDARVAEVVRRVQARLGDVSLLLFSDHGMSSVDELVSYRRLERDEAFPRRFCFALDATMVRLWWPDAGEALRARIRDEVRRGAPGRFLAIEDLRELRLPVPDPAWGEEVYLLEPGRAIFPNFHSLLPPKAMHAYHPDESEQHGFVAGVRSGGSVELVELAPLVLERLGVAQSGGDRRATATMPSASAGRSESNGRESARNAVAAAPSAPAPGELGFA